jgi:flagellar protein FlaG
MTIQPATAGASSAMLAQAAGASTAAPKAAAQAQEAAKASAPVAKLVPTQKVDLGYDPNKERANLQKAIDQLNDQMKDKNRDLSFSLDDRINRTIITVKKLETGEVVRQIPSEDFVKLAHSLEDMKGLLFNKAVLSLGCKANICHRSGKKLPPALKLSKQHPIHRLTTKPCCES